MFRKELTYYFSTPIAYIVIGLYLLAISLFLWVIPGEWNIIDSGYAELHGLFALSPWLLLLVCPALTMHIFSEERKQGTWTLLRVHPLPLWRIVLGKYLAAWLIVVLAQLPCLTHYFAVLAIAEPAGNVDSGAFWGGYIGLLLVSSTLTAIGTFASTLSKSQIVSFLIGLVVGFVLFYGFDLMLPSLAHWGLSYHLTSISRGVLDMRDVVYFLSMTGVFLLATLYDTNRSSF